MTAAPPPWVRTARDVCAALPAPDPARLAARRAQARSRHFAYPYGSGQAEEVALLAGFKPLLRQFLSESDIHAASLRFQQQGLTVAVAEAEPRRVSRPGRFLHVSRDPELARESVAADAAAETDAGRARFGRLLGYPACCVEAFVATPAPRRNTRLIAGALSRSAHWAPRLNMLDLGVFHYLSWAPCSFACTASIAYADRVAARLVACHGRVDAAESAPSASCASACPHAQFVAEVDTALAAHRLLILEDVQLSMTGIWTQGRLEIQRVWPAACDRHPRATLAEDALEAAACVAALLDQVDTLSVVDGVLIADARPLLRATELVLVPFGAGRAPA